MSWSAFAAWDLGTVAISYIRHGAEVIIRPGRLESFYAVSTPVQGSAISRFGRSETESVPQSAVVHPPPQEIAMRWSADCENLALRIDRCALEAELSCMLRRDIDTPVMFEPAIDLPAGTTSSWAATLGFVLDEIRPRALRPCAAPWN